MIYPNLNIKQILIGLSVIAGGVIAYSVYRKARTRNQVTQATKAVTTGTIPTLGINIVDIAAQIGIELGTAFPAYDPRHWTENDEKIKSLVLKVPKPLIPNLVNEYYKKYKRNLVDDLRSTLDEWNEVSYLFT